MTTEKFAADILRRLLHLANVMGWKHAMNSGSPLPENNVDQVILVKSRERLFTRT